nr:MAG TPA: Protein of unknown function (DUF3789) [Caudoviricetes sp.]DAQ58917.1 MAG TPA: Protein of unknown function (DUF3789) [Caudoviricetes sp.]
MSFFDAGNKGIFAMCLCAIEGHSHREMLPCQKF